MHRFIIALCVIAFALAAQAGPITYQGQLQDATGPADTQVDIVFELYEEDEGGSPLASDSHAGVEVSDGLFQVELDFGSGVFDGGERWLQVIVDGQELDPRQPITPAPTALHAFNVPPETLSNLACNADEVAMWDGSGWVCSAVQEPIWKLEGGNVVFDEGQVRAGGPFFSPFGRLTVADEESIAISARSFNQATISATRVGPGDETENVLHLRRRAEDSAQPGMGAQLKFQLEGSGGGTISTGAIESLWVDPENPALADLVFRTRGDNFTGAVQERLRLTHDSRIEMAGELAFQDDSPQRTAGPIAKAYINDNGSIANGVNIESVNWEPGVSGYRVALANENFFLQDFVATVTPRGDATGVSTSSKGGDLLVFFEDEQQRDFQVVIYKLPDGVVTTQSINRLATYERLHGPDDGIRRVGESSGLTNSRPPTADGDDDHALSGHGESKSALATRLHELESEKAELEKRLAALEALLLEDRQIAESQQ